MVKVKSGNLLKAKEDILVHQVNVDGVMGGGVARQLAELFPYLEKNYSIYAENKENNFGKLFGDVLFYSCIEVPKQIVANVFSQDKRFNTNYEALRIAFKKVKKFAMKNNYTIAMPYGIGCGIANGEWGKVYKIIEDVFNDYEVMLYRLEE